VKFNPSSKMFSRRKSSAQTTLKPTTANNSKNQFPNQNQFQMSLFLLKEKKAKENNQREKIGEDALKMKMRGSVTLKRMWLREQER